VAESSDTTALFAVCCTIRLQDYKNGMMQTNISEQVQQYTHTSLHVLTKLPKYELIGIFPFDGRKVPPGAKRRYLPRSLSVEAPG